MAGMALNCKRQESRLVKIIAEKFEHDLVDAASKNQVRQSTLLAVDINGKTYKTYKARLTRKNKESYSRWQKRKTTKHLVDLAYGCHYLSGKTREWAAKQFAIDSRLGRHAFAIAQVRRIIKHITVLAANEISTTGKFTFPGFARVSLKARNGPWQQALKIVVEQGPDGFWHPTSWFMRADPVASFKRKALTS